MSRAATSFVTVCEIVAAQMLEKNHSPSETKLSLKMIGVTQASILRQANSEGLFQCAEEFKCREECKQNGNTCPAGKCRYGHNRPITQGELGRLCTALAENEVFLAHLRPVFTKASMGYEPYRILSELVPRKRPAAVNLENL
tara:strand:+ start:919 stop:1344 length:426 start_codon:yes stop_codon:yes gene_type:complete